MLRLGSSSKRVEKQSKTDLINTFRKLWEQHVMWTRAFIISTAANLEDLQSVTRRLLKNAADMAEQFRVFYGRQRAVRLEELLGDHFLIAARLINNEKAGNTRAAEEERQLWLKNADGIIAFLEQINPYWTKDRWQDLFYSHLEMTENEAVLRLQGKFESDIAQFDLIEEEALKMADLMAEGIDRQFG